jgi:elongation factor 3
MVITEEEEAKLKTPVVVETMDDAGNVKKDKRVIDMLTGVRRMAKSGHEYEVSFVGMPVDKNVFMTGEKLETLGFTKHIKIVDAKVEAREGMYARPLTQDQVEQHLEDVGLDREFGTHNRMSALSGGQKVKVVLAAAMWNQPHIVILDEPTNYLDRESLGALAGAIQEYEGGVVMITHNNEFCSALCPETWVVEHGRLDCRGDPEWMKTVMNEKTTFVQLEEMVDGNGNVVKIKAKKEGLSRNQKKVLAKKKAAARERGEIVSSDEEDD